MAFYDWFDVWLSAPVLRRVHDAWKLLETKNVYYHTRVLCSSQFTEGVSPRSNRLFHLVPPSENEPVRFAFRERTTANYAQPKITITPIAKLYIHELCVIHGSFTSLSLICFIFNMD